MMIERKPFENNEEPVAKRGVKLERKLTEAELLKKSNEKNRSNLQDKLDKIADQAVEAHQDRNHRAMDLAKQFMAAIRDKTLPQNRGVVGADVERELRNSLVSFAIEVNNDSTETYDGMGSVALLRLLLTVVFDQRDRMNDLEYKLAKFQSSSTKPEANG